ncbi:hypothetical protein NWO25_14385 [Enterococcus lactis]|nr:hypothetical protein [Enterococcus lactis]MCU7722047.1 hypothetical protein [Enterococcus faecium]
MKKKQTKLSLADILTQLTATEDGVVEFERSEISVVDDRYFKMPYFLTKQRSFAFVATMGYVITLELELLKKKSFG